MTLIERSLSLLKVFIPEIPVSEDFVSFRHRLAERESGLNREDQDITRFVFSRENLMRWRVEVFWSCERDKIRLAGFVHKGLKIDGLRVAFFGFWDTVDDTEVNRLKFAEFESWAKSCKAQVIYGPINFSTAFEYRLQTDSFEKPVFWGEPKNPKYYNQILSDLGYGPGESYVSYFCKDIGELREEIKKNVAPFMGSLREKYGIVPIEKSSWEERKNEIFKLTENIFMENFAYTRFSKTVFKSFYGQRFLNLICPRTSLFLQDKSTGELVGMAVNFNDGNLSSGRTLLLKTIGVEKKHRHMGATFLLILDEVLKRATDYESAMFCLMKEGNFPSLISEEMVIQKRQYALFKKVL